MGLGWTGNCVSGIAFYTGDKYPVNFVDQVFFSDYGSQWIKSYVTEGGNNRDVFKTQYAFQSLSVALVSLKIHPTTKDICYLELLAGQIHCLAYVNGSQPAIVAIGADKTAGALPLTVQFNSDGTYNRDFSDMEYIAWTFGDGSAVVFDPNPKHTYTKEGIYTVTVHVKNSLTVVNQTMTIMAGHAPPIVRITSPAAGSLNSFSFATYDGAREDADGSDIIQPKLKFDSTVEQSTGKLKFFWDIYMVHTNHYHPESYTQTGASFSATQDELGAASHMGERINFMAILTAQDLRGAIGTSYVRLSEETWMSNPPVAKFKRNPEGKISTGQPIRFDGSASYDIDLDTVSFLWDFGDGMKIDFNPLTINKFAAHSYSQAGTYTVTLTTWDNWGTKNSTSEQIQVVNGYVQSPPTNVAINNVVQVKALPTISSEGSVTPTTGGNGNGDGGSGSGKDQNSASTMMSSLAVVVICSIFLLL